MDLERYLLRKKICEIVSNWDSKLTSIHRLSNTDGDLGFLFFTFFGGGGYERYGSGAFKSEPLHTTEKSKQNLKSKNFLV